MVNFVWSGQRVVCYINNILKLWSIGTQSLDWWYWIGSQGETKWKEKGTEESQETKRSLCTSNMHNFKKIILLQVEQKVEEKQQQTVENLSLREKVCYSNIFSGKIIQILILFSVPLLLREGFWTVHQPPVCCQRS